MVFLWPAHKRHTLVFVAHRPVLDPRLAHVARLNHNVRHVPTGTCEIGHIFPPAFLRPKEYDLSFDLRPLTLMRLHGEHAIILLFQPHDEYLIPMPEPLTIWCNTSLPAPAIEQLRAGAAPAKILFSEEQSYNLG